MHYPTIKQSIANIVILVVTFIGGFIVCFLLFKNAILSAVTPGTFTSGFDAYNVSPVSGFHYTDTLSCTVVHSTTNQYPVKKFTLQSLNTEEPVIVYPSGTSDRLKKVYDDPSYVVLQAPVTAADVQIFTIQKSNGLLVIALSWEQVGKYLFSGAQKGRCAGVSG
mgnify:CR=1 FL=1